MPAVRGVLFDFHETLISADQWVAMETGGIAVEISQRLGLWPGEPPAEDRRKIEDAYTHIRAISRGAAVEYAALAVMRLDAAETVYVGNDYIKDVMGARLARLHAVWVPEASARDYRVHTSVQPDAVADRFDALPEIIGRI